MIDIFDERVDKNSQLLKGLDTLDAAQISDEQQIQIFIEQVKDLFAKERGRETAKKLNLGDIKSTKVETCIILQQHFITKEELEKIH